MFQALLVRLARALDSAGIPYMVIGGQAVLLYGEPRLTRNDVQGILARHDQMDEKYLQRWLPSFRDVVGKDLLAQYRSLKRST
jgi:hypothetical protein